MKPPTSTCSRMVSIWRWGFAFVALSSLIVVDGSNPAIAASIARCELVLDGSTNPPGDRIDCLVLMDPQDRDVRLEICAFLASTTNFGKPVPIDAAGTKNRDKQGQFRVVRRIAITDTDAQQSLILPYADLAIPAGTHRLLYVLELSVAGRCVWSEPLPVSLVRVSDRQRTKLAPQMAGKTESVVADSRRVHLGAESMKVARMTIADSRAENSNATIEKVSIQQGFERVRLESTDLGDEFSGLHAQPWLPLADIASPQQRIAYFATNRELAKLPTSEEESDTTPWRRFDAELSTEIHYGSCVVNFPVRRHKRGRLELASWLQHTDPEKHFLVESMQAFTAEQLLTPIREDDVLLFVHGFNSSFEEAVLRAAQLQNDTDFPGQVVAFSWPSMAVMSSEAYSTDVGIADQSVRALADVLDLLTNNMSDGHKVHVIAHSLGNRLFVSAIAELIERKVWSHDRAYLGQVILAAPDVSAIRFNNVCRYVIQAAQRVSYYYCCSDQALKISQNINKYEPVGLYPFFQDGLDTINADGVDTSFIGHGYYGSSTKVLADFNLLLDRQYAPAQRMPPLAGHNRVFDHDHWSFLPLNIKEQ